MIKGQSMFEVILALFIMSMVIVGIVSLSTRSVSNSSFSQNKTIAGRYSQEAIEWLRSQRDADFAVFKSKATGVYCLNTLSLTNTGVCTSSELINNLYKRQVTFTATTVPNTIIKAEVVTTWVDSKGTHEAVSTTEFTDIRDK